MLPFGMSYFYILVVARPLFLVCQIWMTIDCSTMASADHVIYHELLSFIVYSCLHMFRFRRSLPLFSFQLNAQRLLLSIFFSFNLHSLNVRW